jgi:hypothetical protein
MVPYLWFPIPIEAIGCESVAPGEPVAENESYMKSEHNPTDDDDLRPEHDLSQLEGEVRGKYVERYRQGTNLALLAPEVRAAFPTDDAVNQALRTLINPQSPSS